MEVPSVPMWEKFTVNLKYNEGFLGYWSDCSTLITY